MFIFIQFTVNYCNQMCSCSRRNTICACSGTNLDNQNKKIQRLSSLSVFINSGGYWILRRHITADFQPWRIVETIGWTEDNQYLGLQQDTGRHHHYTMKPSHLLLSTFLLGLQQQRTTLGLSADVIYSCVCVCLVSSSKANKTCLGHAVMHWDVNSPICGIRVWINHLWWCVAKYSMMISWSCRVRCC